MTPFLGLGSVIASVVGNSTVSAEDGKAAGGGGFKLPNVFGGLFGGGANEINEVETTEDTGPDYASIAVLVATFVLIAVLVYLLTKKK